MCAKLVCNDRLTDANPRDCLLLAASLVRIARLRNRVRDNPKSFAEPGVGADNGHVAIFRALCKLNQPARYDLRHGRLDGKHCCLLHNRYIIIDTVNVSALCVALPGAYSHIVSNDPYRIISIFL